MDISFAVSQGVKQALLYWGVEGEERWQGSFTSVSLSTCQRLRFLLPRLTRRERDRERERERERVLALAGGYQGHCVH